MEVTNEQIKKGQKKIRKEIRTMQSNSNMWFAFIIILLIASVFIGHSSASSTVTIQSKYYNNFTPAYSISFPAYWLDSTSAGAACTAYGWSPLSAHHWLDYTDPTHYSYNTSYGTYGSSWPKTTNYYGWSKYEYIECSGGNIVQVEWLAWNGTPPEPLAATFTAIPQSGNQSLNVSFTPNIVGSNLNRVVWDFDGGLGGETKYSNFNTSFNKTYINAGHFTARLTAYNDTSSVTASQRIDVYNYTAGITPTPTLTPVPTTTYTNTSSFYFKMKGHDVSNGTPIAGLSIGEIDTDDVGSGWFNQTAANGEYTFNGYGSGGTKAYVPYHTYMFQFSKTGYVSTSHTSMYTPGTTGEDYDTYLTPIAYNPSTANFVLAISLASTSGGNVNGGIGTVTISNQSSTWTATSTNPTNNVVMFAGLTPSASYKIDINLNGYKSYTGYFASSSSMAGTTPYYMAYLEPTDLLPSNFVLSVSPESGNYNDTYSLTLTGDISTANQISYKYYTNDQSRTSFTTTGGYTQYSKVGGSWKAWDGSTYTSTVSNPASVTGKMQASSNLGADTVNVIAYITINGNVYQATDTIRMVTAGKEPKIIVAYDMSEISGATAARFTNSFDSHILDIYTGIWTNTTVSNGDVTYYYYTPGNVVTYFGTATGYYQTATQSKVLNEGSGGIEYKFYKITAAPRPENVTLHASVTSSSTGMGISDAYVNFSDGQHCYTNQQGSCGVWALSGISYSATAKAYGYTSGIGSITTSNTTQNVINIVLVKTTTTTNPDVTPYPTRTISNERNSSIPIVTPKGWNETNVATCGGNATDIIQATRQGLACAGFNDGMSQSLGLASIIIIFFVVVGARWGKGLGAGLGAVIGFVMCLAAGILPFMILAVVIVLLILIAAIIIFGGVK